MHLLGMPKPATGCRDWSVVDLMNSEHLTDFRIEVPHRGSIMGWTCEDRHAPRGVGIIHGLGDHAGRYTHVGRALAARGFMVEAIDLPGHGSSYGARGHISSWNEYRSAVTAWMDRARAQAPLRRWTLLGQSMGAFVVLEWALSNSKRVERLILCAPPFQLGFRPSMLKVKAAQVIVRVWPGFSQGNMILPSMLSHDPAMVRAHMDDPLVHYKISARLFFEFNGMRTALLKTAPRLTIPTLILQGGEDPIAAPEGTVRWAGQAPGALVTLRLYPDLYHEVLCEIGRDENIASMIDWLERDPTS